MISGFDSHAIAFANQATAKEVHRGGEPTNPSDESGAWRFVHFLRCSNLLNSSVVHDDNHVAHGHGLNLIVSDKDRRDAERLLQMDEFGTQRLAERGIECGQWFVEQERGGITNDGFRDRDALPFSIAWCRSLSHNNYDNNISRITANVLDRFLSEAPFETH